MICSIASFHHIANLKMIMRKGIRIELETISDKELKRKTIESKVKDTSARIRAMFTQIVSSSAFYGNPIYQAPMIDVAYSSYTGRRKNRTTGSA
jgi:hypothetical protein